MSTFRDAARRLQRMARVLLSAEREVAELTGDDLLATALKFSSGAADRNTLARADHPYARRHGSPRLNPAIINEQTGVFKRAWKLRVKRTSSGMSVAVWNEDPKAVFLQAGTRFMFARPLDQRVVAEVRPRWEARWRFAIRRLQSL